MQKNYTIPCMQRLQKILRLVKKTGDKIIVMSEREDADFLLMSLDEYEKIIDNTNSVKNLTEEELLDKINRDIALWKNAQADDSDGLEFGPSYYSHKNLEDENDFSDSWNEDIWNQEPWKKYSDENEEDLEDFMPNDLSFEKELPWDKEKKSILSETLSFGSEDEKEQKPIRTQEESLKYENIPPPPDLSPAPAIVPEEKSPVIDISFEGPATMADIPEDEDKFEEEPVY